MTTMADNIIDDEDGKCDLHKDDYCFTGAGDSIQTAKGDKATVHIQSLYFSNSGLNMYDGSYRSSD